MADVKEAIMQMALKEFTKELKNPNSPASKKFKGMLYGDPSTGEGGLFEKFTDGSIFDEKSNTKPTDEKSNTKPTEEEISAELSKYKRNAGQAALDNFLQGGGTVAKGAGKVWNAYHGLLGDALLAVTKSVQSQGYDNPFYMSPAVAAGRKALGNIGEIAGDTAGTIMQDVGKDVKSEREKEREVELLLRQRPSGQFYDARRKLTN